MKMEELKDLSVAELEAKLAELKNDSFRLRFRGATESIENPMQFRKNRRDIARINTILRARRTQAEGVQS
ncbi:MAG TPA: 50S ribosomal protein L29 [Gemmatimonadales bacterium]|nr:50S ribosomal protein L29 [Gemmatimonadales bacterium]